MKTKVGLTYDLKEKLKIKGGDPKDLNAEFDVQATIDIIADALRQGGNDVRNIGNVYNLLKCIDNLDVDIVFNIAEGIGDRNRESQVPILLGMKNIPCVGSDGLTLALTLDKIMAKRIMLQAGIPTPNYVEIDDPANLNGTLDRLKFPMIVKPRHEGSSIGISEDSRVGDQDSLKSRISHVVNAYNQAALVEEFIIGREFTVGLIGNDPNIKALPPVQVKIDGNLYLGEKFYTFARISSDKLEYVCPAEISPELNKKICDVALSAYRAVECKDFGRVDIRLDQNDAPYVLEINPLPSLSVEDIFMIVTRQINCSFPDIINMILDAGLKRHGLR